MMLLLRLASAFHEEDIRYALVGGYAVNLHGAIRGTMDIDLAIALRQLDFIKVEKALNSLGLVSRLPVTSKEVFQFRKEYIERRNLVAWSFYNPKDPSEIVDIIITQDAQKLKIKRFSLQGVPLLVASISDLIRMKKMSGRPQDLLDVKALQLIEREAK
jgi:hypothetical protein